MFLLHPTTEGNLLKSLMCDLGCLSWGEEEKEGGGRKPEREEEEKERVVENSKNRQRGR